MVWYKSSTIAVYTACKLAEVINAVGQKINYSINHSLKTSRGVWFLSMVLFIA